MDLPPKTVSVVVGRQYSRPGHLCNYCTKIFVNVVNTCVCRRSVDNKASILSYPILSRPKEIVREGGGGGGVFRGSCLNNQQLFACKLNTEIIWRDDEPPSRISLKLGSSSLHVSCLIPDTLFEDPDTFRFACRTKQFFKVTSWNWIFW